MADSIFDARTRLQMHQGALHGEPDFVYWNRSGRLPAQRFRDATERWFARYPDEHQRELRQRLRSKDNEPHRAAFFELALHEMFLRAGLNPEIHPPVPGTEKRPDFGLRGPDGTILSYVEAVRASGVSAEASAAENRINTVYEALEKVESPDFFVGLRLRGTPETSPPARAMRDFLQRKLTAADYDSVSAQEGLDAWEDPAWTFRHDGWEVGFFPIPKTEDARGERGIRPLGLFFSGARSIDPIADLRSAIKRKATRYGEPDAPLIIAVNGAGIGADRDAMMKALFGSFVFQFPTNGGPSQGRMVRQPDGIWYGGSEPKNTRVSGVLHVDYTYVTGVAGARLCLIENPWATAPPPKLKGFSRLEVVDGSGEFREIPGLAAHELLSLESADFPGADAPD